MVTVVQVFPLLELNCRSTDNKQEHWSALYVICKYA
ncbi:hypothetical protein RRG08_000551, partial [Elysia crispata]